MAAFTKDVADRSITRWVALLKGYGAADDDRVASGNLIALVLAWNTPFYPLYLLMVGGTAVLPGAWLTLCAFPVFLAVPAITRSRPFFGRVLLVVAALLNTLFCTWLLGEASGTQLFLLPCITLAALLFRRSERVALYGLLALPLVLGVLMEGRYPPSPFGCSGPTCGAILRMNSMSVAALLIFLGYLMSARVEPGKPT